MHILIYIQGENFIPQLWKIVGRYNFVLVIHVNTQIVIIVMLERFCNVQVKILQSVWGSVSHSQLPNTIGR